MKLFKRTVKIEKNDCKFRVCYGDDWNTFTNYFHDYETAEKFFTDTCNSSDFTIAYIYDMEKGETILRLEY